MEQELRPLTAEEHYDIDGGSAIVACAVSATEVGVSCATGFLPGVIFGVAGILASCYD